MCEQLCGCYTSSKNGMLLVAPACLQIRGPIRPVRIEGRGNAHQCAAYELAGMYGSE